MFTHRVVAALLLGVTAVAAVPAAAAVEVEGATNQKNACSTFKQKYPDYTFLPNSPGYIWETQGHYWSATLAQSPACVFVPQNENHVSWAVSTLTLTSTKFAVRGGGHMPIPGYNNIDSPGVLLSTSNLTTLTLSRDKSVVSVGPGNRWRDVYAYLQPSGLAAIGGRVGKVGVPGLLLGGGISFYSNQYGFAADNVVKYQVVLASGSVVEATATNSYSDLFWALKGGGNSFAIVTRFDLRTVKSPQVWVGIAQYDQSQAQKYLDAVYNFGKYGSLDSKAAIIPTIVTFPGMNVTAYAAAKFYDSTVNNPKPFENFTAPNIMTVADSYALQPLSTYIASTDPLQPDYLRQEFRVMSSIVSRDAVQLIHDTFLSQVYAKLSNIAGIQASLTFQPVTKEFIRQGINNGGNPQGVDISKAPYFWMVENWSWTDEADDDTVYAFAKGITADIMKMLKKKGLAADYLYMNDAGKGQEIFQHYPPANLARLKQIRAKYDPLKIYTALLTGGWKVSQA
ncbi:FAD binding domain-containing protein [Polyplosphaeria fusca]|uniref:FAD binding domain-containing protein n=1 Tax=Polyplosphaeria fusca TaxID=682080 RepID=A0A9P4V1Y5_9PLEO|nr:FAD binding domain-containing protein [Polyplosphaeria fusca]